MSLVRGSKSTWATETDWDTHKELITRLYWDERRTLKRVQELMRSKYGFNATEKMYKSRFRQWHLMKNRRSCGARPIVQDAVISNGTNSFMIRDHKVGAITSRFYMVNMISSSESLRLPRQLVSPDAARYPEESLLAVVQFAKARLQYDSFGFTEQKYDWNDDLGMLFWQDVRSATSKISSNDDNKAASFRLLNKAFDWYSSALEAAEPSLIWTSLISVLFLAEVAEDLTSAFVRYSTNLSSIKLGSSHPIARLWFMIRSMSLEEYRQAVATIIGAYLTALRSDLRSGVEFRLVSMLHVARWLTRVNSSTFDASSAIFQAVLEEFRTTTDSTGQWIFDEWYWWTRGYHCLFLSESGRKEEANEAMVAVGAHWHNGYPDFTYDKLLDLFLGERYYTTRAIILEQLGRMSDATSYYLAAYTVAKRVSSTNWRYRLASTTTDLETHYRRIGDTESAERIRDEAAAHWDVLVNQEVSERNQQAQPVVTSSRDVSINHADVIEE